MGGGAGGDGGWVVRDGYEFRMRRSAYGIGPFAGARRRVVGGVGCGVDLLLISRHRASELSEV